jgi:hypothetical protein
VLCCKIKESLLLQKYNEVNSYNDLVPFNPALKVDGTYEGIDVANVEGFSTVIQDNVKRIQL